MKKLLLIVFSLLVVAGGALAAKVVPYTSLAVNARLAYDFSTTNVAEDATAVDKFFAFFNPFKTYGDMTADLGLIGTLNENDSLIGMISLQSFAPQIANGSSSSYIDGETQQNQVIVAKYIHKFDDTFLVRGSGDFFNQFYRMSKLEDFGDGLYDFRRFGVTGEVEKVFSEQLQVFGDIAYHYNAYPNYFDLYYKYFDPVSNKMRDDVDVEEFSQNKLPLNNHNFHLYGNGSFSPTSELTLGVEYVLELYAYPQSMIYFQQSANADEKQFDDYHDIILGLSYKLGKVTFGFDLHGIFYDSNQYYPMISGSGTLAQETIILNYSYRQFGVEPSITAVVRERDLLGVQYTFHNVYSPELPITDAEGNWSMKRQNQNIMMVNLFYIVSPREYIYISHTLTYKTCWANSALEMYNYSVVQYALSVKYEY